MQAESLDLQQVRIGSLPIIRKFTNALSIKELLCEALHQSDYADALETLTLSALLRPDALYRVGQWANAFDDGLVRKGLSDDILGRALDRLFKADRASLLTKLTLTAIDKFKIDTSQLHNDSTSVKFAGAYEKQHPKAVQLKRGTARIIGPTLSNWSIPCRLPVMALYRFISNPTTAIKPMTKLTMNFGKACVDFSGDQIFFTLLTQSSACLKLCVRLIANRAFLLRFCHERGTK